MNKTFDMSIFLPAFLLSALSVVLIYAATFYSASPVLKMIYQKQVIWFGLGLVVCAIIYFIPLRFHEAFAYVYYGLACVLLVFLLLYSKGSSSRWISLGFFNVQPAELAKLAVVFSLARFLGFSKLKLDEFRWVFAVLAIIALPAGLILIQPDLGSSLVFFAIFIALIIWSGLSPGRILMVVTPVIGIISAFHWLSWAIFIFLLLVLIFVTRLRLWQGVFFFLANLIGGMITPVMWNNLHTYQQKRIITFLDPGQDPRGAGYQIIQSKIAVGAGGFFGQGFLQGTQTKLNFLPERHTDFIFSVLAEQFGFFGSVIVIALFCIIFYRGFAVALKARNQFFGYAACGLTAVMAFQVLINIGMTIGLTPVTGLPLPFLSYGGSSLLFFWAAIGLLLAINRDWQEY
ncbi:MAG: rod shape-determining protein RodA [candidate division Zixibacteria bacterium]